MDTVEKHVLFEDSGKIKNRFRVEDQKMNPQNSKVIHACMRRAARMRTEVWIKNACATKKNVIQMQNFTVLYNYTAHTSVCMVIFPHFSPGVDDCSQVLSTARGQPKKRRIKSLFESVQEKTTNEKTSYPQIVQYLWITQPVARLVMASLPYSPVCAAGCTRKMPAL